MYKAFPTKQYEKAFKKLKHSGKFDETKLNKIIPCVNKVDGILFLGVHPGREHQSFIQSVYKNISILRKFDKKIKIQVDGGVNPQVIIKLLKLHVDYINSGSFISNSENPKEAFKKLNFLFSEYKK
jgi:ribulose-phosphate 3-epimerase